MDHQTEDVAPRRDGLPVHRPVASHGPSRRRFLQAGVGGLAAACAVGAAACYLRRRSRSLPSADVFPHDAPSGDFWEAWQARGWTAEARHYLKLGRNVQCKLCPNQCLLEPEDRSHCRTRVNKDGVLYTLAYGNPCALHLDPIEKKPLFHFLPGATALSLAAAGCVYRCLNCQNWEISQARPDETKKPDGPPQPLNADTLQLLPLLDMDRVSLFPDDVVALAEQCRAPAVAYTYSEPTAWYEYMFDTARGARAKNIKNLWITCGSIQEEPLVELCRVIDAANVDLKGFDPEIYRKLNSGSLETVLNTLKVLKREGVWFEITHLVVPSYTDDLDTIRRMCDWLVLNLGPDYPLHFSRFQPQHKLAHLSPTPLEILARARDAARSSGLRYVYLGNVRELEDAETTSCPGCRKTVIDRSGFRVAAMKLNAGRCAFCGVPIAGVWA